MKNRSIQFVDKSAKSVLLSDFIANYKIANPTWDNLPEGFPYCDVSNLNKQEKIILEAATMAWINEHPLDYFGQKLTQGIITTSVLFLISSVAISFLYYINVNSNLGLTFLTEFFA